jgi:hypothetical protein
MAIYKQNIQENL